MNKPAGDGRPQTNSVVARWEGGWRCRVTAGEFDLVVDEPQSAGGTGTGPMPTEYLLTAMASCYALALAWAAAKRQMSLPGLTVTATGTYDGPRFTRLQLTVASKAPPGAVERLIEPALRACYVSNTLAASPPVEITIGGPGPAAGLPPRAVITAARPVATCGRRDRPGPGRNSPAVPRPRRPPPGPCLRCGAGSPWSRPG